MTWGRAGIRVKAPLVEQIQEPLPLKLRILHLKTTVLVRCQTLFNGFTEHFLSLVEDGFGKTPGGVDGDIRLQAKGLRQGFKARVPE